jgi:hypothetical protein
VKARSRPSLLLAVDPGVTTGVAMWEQGANVYMAEIEDQLRFCDLAERALRIQYRDMVVVCESFRVTMETAKKSQQPASLEIIGCLRWLCHTYGAEFVLQTPADAKAFSTDEKLKKADLYRPGQGHANDAARHAYLWLSKNHMAPGSFRCGPS